MNEVSAQNTENFARLRETLIEPTQENWKALLELLEQWPEDSMRLALDYAKIHLSEWPDKLRSYPFWEPEELLLKPKDWFVHELATTIAIEELVMAGRYGRKVAKAVVSDPNLTANLRYLSFHCSEIEDPIGTAIAKNENFKNLHTLDLFCSEFIHKGARAIARSPFLRNLRILKIRYCGNGAQGRRVTQALAKSPNLANLHTLSLKYSEIGFDDIEGIKALASSPNLSKLRILDLEDNSIGNGGVIALTHSVHIKNLQSLDLRNNKIGDAGAIALANSPNFSNLQYLELSENDLGDMGARALASSPNLSNLQSLYLESNDKLGSEGIQTIGFSENLGTSVRSSYLRKLTKKALIEESSKRGLKGLSKLNKDKIIELILEKT